MYTYIISDGTAIKIGKIDTKLYSVSYCMKSRLKSLQTGNPRKLRILGGFRSDIETSLHRRFKDFRLHGEWFENCIAFKIFETRGYLHKDNFLYGKTEVSLFK